MPIHVFFNHRKTVRLAAAMLGKVVDGLAPALTSMLVRGKEVKTHTLEIRVLFFGTFCRHCNTYNILESQSTHMLNCI